MISEITVTSSHISGETFRRMVLNAGACIRSNENAINDLNVFPVPDGDTGSNMSMTICSAVNDLIATHNDSIGDVAAVTASAMLRGARGNSGVILSLFFRGMSKALKGVESCDGITWAKALCAGVEAAYKAISSPAEGTILTVARLAAERAITAAEEINNFEYVLDAAYDAAKDALANTVNQNPVLKKAGVVDAGGMGWVVALNAMLDAIHSDGEIMLPEEIPTAPEGKADFESFNTEDIKFAYCVGLHTTRSDMDGHIRLLETSVQDGTNLRARCLKKPKRFLQRSAANASFGREVFLTRIFAIPILRQDVRWLMSSLIIARRILRSILFTFGLPMQATTSASAKNAKRCFHRIITL